MIFNNPDALQLWINIFFTVAAASVAFASAALAVGIRDLRRPVVPVAVPVTDRHPGEVQSAPTRRAA